MISSVCNMEKWRGSTLYRVTDKGVRVVKRKRTKHIPRGMEVKR